MDIGDTRRKYCVSVKMPNFTKTIKQKVKDLNYFTLQLLIKQFLITRPPVKNYLAVYNTKWCSNTIEECDDYFIWDYDDLEEQKQYILDSIGSIASSVFMLEMSNQELYYEFEFEDEEARRKCEFNMGKCDDCDNIHIHLKITSTEEENPLPTQQQQQTDISENPI